MVELFYLPSCSPELNPDERLNGDLKYQIQTGLAVRSKEQLSALVSDNAVADIFQFSGVNINTDLIKAIMINEVVPYNPADDFDGNNIQPDYLTTTLPLIVSKKAMCVILYSLGKASYNMLANIFDTWPSLVYRWIVEAEQSCRNMKFPAKSSTWNLMKCGAL